MSVDLKSPFAEFLYASLTEYRQHLGQGTPLNRALWVEHVGRAHQAWHDARKPKRAKPRAAFVPPTPEEVTAYSIEIGYPLDGVAWCLSYAQKNWKISDRATMKNWRLAVQHWKREGYVTKHRPSMPAPECSIESAPVGWLEWTRANCPNWGRLEEEAASGVPVPAWNRLRVEERSFILKQMAKG